ncbi:MAG: hypothetical protein A3J06_01480 [Candidatus Moranbacteria bacterium RIFCSPLOWO2_02_FULL_48_19]|nr:MAG: hypothetical protein A3J06_01480 [Candidatus Moranbacteria bacterium RIFCSPLOWO2_02_FULL_48_19]OGI30355.1 MAG: hypothetical protein A3G09_02685 [Candidatus Moranbacteria bacterium RIFCSPLOWO2_12_FULL_48_12]
MVKKPLRNIFSVFGVLFLFIVLSIIGRIFSQKGTSSFLGLFGNEDNLDGAIPPASADVGGACDASESCDASEASEGDS